MNNQPPVLSSSQPANPQASIVTFAVGMTVRVKARTPITKGKIDAIDLSLPFPIGVVGGRKRELFGFALDEIEVA